MLYLTVMLIAFVLALAVQGMKGKPCDFFGIRLRKMWLAIVAFVLQTVTRILGIRGVESAVKFSFLIQAVVFVLLLFCFWFNREYIGLWFVGLGASLNALVMLVNGGRMPVSLEAMQKAGIKEVTEMIMSGADNKHAVISSTTKLKFLADIIHLPGFIGQGMGVVSIGDLVVALGLFVFVFELFTHPMTALKALKKENVK
ncbi:DUF5317 domain-containing protein [Acetivibrio thermocellus]|uniref:DUF5317 domain-containing protein n=1 Tax=Acetivibrio thermocellus TaxID=1515 RepID=UPI0021ADF166|nr:DUF5317 domain-containing protein [Acetivibrio thermocellus]UWV47776.1 DUF5317 domain-containing protein [Acetivibrio thermocellus]